jgi:D-alanyl-lipoteichoic acid acyltransferase DltB (MBOAT superfamily)
MLFNTLPFAVFFCVVLLAHRLVPREARNGVLLVASLVFYTLWLPAYLLLLLGDVLVNYLLLQRMVKSERPKLYLTLSVVFTLCVLGGFKYATMVVTTLTPLLDGLFGFEPPLPEVFLPLGISFYSFQLLALTIDTYRGQIEPIHSFRRYLLFISFFPQLIAGPILRGHEFLPQLETGGETSFERTRRGLWLIATGLFKKVVLADFLLSTFVNDRFNEDLVGSTPFLLVGIYSFAFQIYYDFSGYTDMARGMALLMGFELPLNFSEPYLSRNPSEFWRRWHITLSRWLQDYLYIPLGGNRMGSFLTYRNLMITMLLGGLWHGASWNFVIWGGLHGLILVMHRRFGKPPPSLDAKMGPLDYAKAALLFHVVCVIWVFFRAETFDGAVHYLELMLTSGNTIGWPVLQTTIVVLCVALHVLERAARLHAPALRERMGAGPLPALAEGVVFGLVVGTAIMVSGAGGEFIYFQF